MKDIKRHIILRMRRSGLLVWSLLIIFGITGSILLITSCDTTIQGSYIGENAVTISRYIEDNQETYTMFWEMLLRTDLKNTLNAYNPNGAGYTLFMPSDDAFNRYISGSEDYNSFEDLLSDTDFSNYLIRYHIVNISIQTNDFPFGALPDTTATGDFLTIGFDANIDSTIYRINNLAPVVVPNIELINGYIHVIDDVLEPVVYSSYEWIYENEDYSILAEALTITGLKDTMGIYRYSSSGSLVKNLYTLLAEPDSIYAKKGIFNIDDLIEAYETPGLELTEVENEFYQFTAYHIMEGSYFLDEFDGTRNFNTVANFPVRIAGGLEIQINPGNDTLDIVIEGGDTTIIKHVRIDMLESNIVTKNGAVHVLKDVMEVKTPGITKQTFQFFEEPVINGYRKDAGEYELTDPEDMEVLFWIGPESIKYVKFGSSMAASNNDYIEIDGNFQITYTIPKILPGQYKLKLKVESKDDNNATINVSVDGKKIGGSIDLTSGGNPYKTYTAGVIEFLIYESHEVTVSSLLPGILKWDFVEFEP